MGNTEIAEKELLKGYIPIQMPEVSIEEPVRQKPVMEPKGFEAEHPNLMGAFGVAQEFVPYLKYVDPEERKQFSKLSQQEQVRDLLLQDLQLVTIGLAGPIGKGLGKLAKPVANFVKSKLPKTYKLLTTELKGYKKIELPTRSEVDELTKDFTDIPYKVPKGEEVLPKEEVLKLTHQKEIISKIIKEGIKDPSRPIMTDSSRRVMYDVAETVEKYPQYAEKILKRYDITPEELANDILHTASQAGKSLNQLSQFSKAMKKAFPKDEAVQTLLGKFSQKGLTPWELTKNIYKKIDNVRRQAMVGQIATAARNAISQAGRYSVSIFDDAIRGTIETVTGKAQPKNAYADMLEDFTAIWRKITPSGRKRVTDVLNKYPEAEAELLSAPIQDITLGGKISRAVMFLNRTQEYLFRKVAFDARVTSLSKKAGIDLATAKELPKEILDDAVKHALDITFAANPAKGGPGNAILKAYEELPMLTLALNPFPRFWANSLKFLWDFNPTGFITAASRAALNKGGKGSIEAASKAITGTLLLGTAMQVRKSKYAGDKWYQIKVPIAGKDRNVDTRAFAPFSSYLFIAEALLNSKNLSGMDYAQGVIGINRIAGTGLVLVDALRSDSIESTGKLLKDFTGQALGGFTVPLRSIKDLMAAFDKYKAEGTSGSTREKPILGPAAENIPIVGTNYLPRSQRLTRSEPYTRELSAVRQATGLTVSTNTPLESEISRLNIRGLYPKTGDRELDRKVIDAINEKVEKEGQRMVETKAYNEDSDTGKALKIKELVSKSKQEKTQKVAHDHYKEKLSKIKTNSAKVKYIKYLGEKKRVSFDVLKMLADGIGLSKKEKKEIAEYYRKR